MRKRSALIRARILVPGHYSAPAAVPPWGAAEYRAAAGCVLRNWIVRGPHVEQLVSEVRRLLGVRYALPFNRARTAIEVAMHAMEIGPDSDVVMPSFLFRGVPDAVARTGARPVYADVGPDLQVRPETIAAAITPATRCVLVPHLFGNTAPIDAIEDMLRGSGIALLDEASQSLGARRGGRLAGTFGRCGVLSFAPQKPAQAPSGGMLVTNDPDLYRRAASVTLPDEPAGRVAARALAVWWWLRLGRYTMPLKACFKRLQAYPSQAHDRCCTMPDLSAAIALCQIRALDANAQRRRANARRLVPHAELAGRILTDLGAEGVATTLALLLPSLGPSLQGVDQALAEIGLQCGRGYPPCHLRLDGARPSLPTTEALWDRCVCLPIDLPARRPERVREALGWNGTRP